VSARVIVVGSGAAALSAALAAARGGAEVTVLERSEYLGGTTAISGGIAWLPCSRVAVEAGVGDFDDDLAATFVNDAPRVAQAIEDHSPLQWSALLEWPDYQAQLPGGLLGGRSIWPKPLPVPPELAARIQPTPEVPQAPMPEGGRLTDAVVLRGPVRGRVLVAGLLVALEELGVDVRRGTHVDALVPDGSGGVRGVRSGTDEHAGVVVLATGGFQHDPALVRTFLPVPEVAAMGPPGCSGDAVRFARSVDAAFGNMADAWWMPAIRVPGEEINGAPFFRPLHHERAQPGSIMVDRTGRRFVDEAQNYTDAGRAMLRFDAGAYTWPASPCWLVFDRAYRERTTIGPLAPGEDDPAWLHRADDLSALAARLGLPAGALEDTVETFNAHAKAGSDPEFGRGSHPYSRWIGDPDATDPNLAPLDAAPFYAVEVLAGCLGTKGGPRTDRDGRVVRDDGAPVPGLFAAGNAAANPFGIGSPGGGGTIGPALVFGTRAGEAASS
jgi:3-oxosteroid 1-dehydrogenase